MVKVTREESLFCKTVIVAEATGCFEIVSNTVPFIVPLFCANAETNKSTVETISKIFFINLLVFPKKFSGYGYENILIIEDMELSRVELMLTKVKLMEYADPSLKFQHTSLFQHLPFH